MVNLSLHQAFFHLKLLCYAMLSKITWKAKETWVWQHNYVGNRWTNETESYEMSSGFLRLTAAVQQLVVASLARSSKQPMWLPDRAIPFAVIFRLAIIKLAY